MIRWAMGLISVLFLVQGARAQAMVEYGLGAGAAVTGIGGLVFGKTSPVPKPPAVKSKAAPAAETAAGPGGSVANTPPAAPKPNYEDPAGIKQGMNYEALSKRFGPAALAFTDGPNLKALTYLGKGGSVQVELKDDVVSSVVAKGVRKIMGAEECPQVTGQTAGSVPIDSCSSSSRQ